MRNNDNGMELAFCVALKKILQHQYNYYWRTKKMKIGIIGVGKSNNIGDQLIAKCLGITFKEELRDVEINYYDLFDGEYDADFEHQPSSSTKLNKEIKKPLYAPRFIKLYLFDMMNNKFENARAKKFIGKNDIIIIGGGHLLIDNFCSFAFKIKRLLKISKSLNKKVIFWGVGVGSKLSLAWLFLMKKNLRNIPIFTRDSKSKERLSLALKRNDIDTIIDPAFFSHLIESPKDVHHDNNKLTLFIMDPYEMARHSNYFYSRDYASNWWKEFIELCTKKYDVTIANNGSISDFNFIKKYIEPSFAPQKVKILNRALSYRDIITAVKKSDRIVAQRLHAVIPSITLEKSLLAIQWDNKLSDILADLNLNECLFSYSDTPQSVFLRLSENVIKVNKSNLDFHRNYYLQKLRTALNA